MVVKAVVKKVRVVKEFRVRPVHWSSAVCARACYCAWYVMRTLLL